MVNVAQEKKRDLKKNIKTAETFRLLGGLTFRSKAC